MKIPRCLDTAEEAIAAVREAREKWLGAASRTP
jgi:hypothetical protein